MAFQFLVNQTVSNDWNAMFSWMTFMAGNNLPTPSVAGWTITSSGDGSALYSGTGNVISNYTASTAGSLANTNAWFVMKEPSGGTYSTLRSICVQNKGTNSWSIAVSQAAGFIGGATTSTVPPTATDAQYLFSTNSTTGYSLFGSGYGASFRFNMAADTTTTHRFYTFAFPVGGGAPIHAMFLDDISPALSGDTMPWIISAGSSGALEYGIAGGSYNQIWGPLTTTTASNVMSDMSSVSYSFTTPTSGLPPDPYSSKDMVFPIIWYSVNPSPGGYKGVSTMLRWEGTGTATAPRPTPTGLTLSTANDNVVVGYCVLPWNGTAPS